MWSWEKLGFNTKDDCIAHVLMFIKKYEKNISNRGYGHAKIMNGELETILELKGDVIKSKKGFIHEDYI